MYYMKGIWYVNGVGPNGKVCGGWGGMKRVGLEVCLGDPNCAVQEAVQRICVKFRKVVIVFYI